jgi:hypothetical protein
MICRLCRDNSCSKSTEVKMTTTTTTSQKATLKARKRKICDLEAKVSDETLVTNSHLHQLSVMPASKPYTTVLNHRRS